MDMTSSQKELGPQIATLKPNLANFFAGIVLGLLSFVHQRIDR
jgi:hypothetical protein